MIRFIEESRKKALGVYKALISAGIAMHMLALREEDSCNIEGVEDDKDILTGLIIEEGDVMLSFKNKENHSVVKKPLSEMSLEELDHWVLLLINSEHSSKVEELYEKMTEKIESILKDSLKDYDNFSKISKELDKYN